MLYQFFIEISSRVPKTDTGIRHTDYLKEHCLIRHIIKTLR